MRFKYKKMSINDKINYKSYRCELLRNLGFKKVTRGFNYDQYRFGLNFENPLIGKGNKAYNRLLKKGIIAETKAYLLGSGFMQED